MAGFVYKIIDNNGRVTIPKAMRDEAGISIGDIVKVSVDTNDCTVRVSRFDFIDVSEGVSDNSPNRILNVIDKMPSDKKVELASHLLDARKLKTSKVEVVK